MEKSDSKPKIFIETLGCQMNMADSEEMGRHFQPYGIFPARSKEEADIVILNTCTVRQHAEDKALSFIGRMKSWKKRKPQGIFIVAGCAAERLKTSLKKRFPQIDHVFGAKSIEDFPKLVARLPLKKVPAFNWFEESESAFGQGELRSEGDPLALGGKTSAFVTVMRGCNYSCSYCVVPSVRGREVYRPPEKILEEVQTRTRQGAREIMLLGQTVNSYWYKQDGIILDFADLLDAVEKTEAVQSVKFMSPHPHYMSDKLIRVLGQSAKISPEIHLPVQSGSDKILKLMKRNYTRAEYVRVAGRLRAAVPGIKLSTDFIVGFPGETEADFSETLALAENLQFSLAFCFKYSARPGTESAQIPDEVSLPVKEERLERLLECLEQAKRRKITALAC